ncbi:protein shisa-7-like isoform X2 [Narcine bancroftii]|uniref:protein shisa-7-like isoform X2 n=1 Tax=Narcine bancroftii TaxID=1343680 RepID=UPI0038313988
MSLNIGPTRCPWFIPVDSPRAEVTQPPRLIENQEQGAFCLKVPPPHAWDCFGGLIHQLPTLPLPTPMEGPLLAGILLCLASGVASSQPSNTSRDRPPPALSLPESVGDLCLGYFDVMGQFDPPFNCTAGSYLYCCGTCHYRFCCEFRSYQLAQAACTNYHRPEWAKTPASPSTALPAEGTDSKGAPGAGGAIYVVCAGLCLALAAAVGVKLVFRKVARQPPDLNVSRALINILRHEAVSPPDVEHNDPPAPERMSPPSDNPPSIVKNHCTPSKVGKTSSGNPCHNYKHLPLSSPSHTGTLPLDRSRHQLHTRPALMTSCSYHNLAHLPPTYEAAVRHDMSRYSSLRRLAAKDVDDCCKRRLMAELSARGTLPLPPRRRAEPREACPTFNPRRVMSQDRLLGWEPAPPAPRPGTAGSRERLLSPERRGTASPYALPHKTLSQGTAVGGGACSPRGLPGPAQRRQAFATKRHSTVEQLHFIPGHPATQGRAGGKAEVTV